MMKREFTKYLTDWKKRSNRKPLMVRGARQVGKIHVISDFGKQNYKEFIKINFEETPEIKDFFKTNNVKEVLQNLEIYLSVKIDKDSCLLFLDEIQACPEAIVTLRYFYEIFPELNIITAGSLLDHTLNTLDHAMPVGRIEFAYLYPMDFYQ